MQRRRVVAVSALLITFGLVACNAILGIGDPEGSPPGAGNDAQVGSQNETGPDADGATDGGKLDGGDCDFKAVTLASKDYAGWPMPNGFRGETTYQTTGNEVRDMMTGLVWMKAPQPELTLAQATSFCDNAAASSLGKWRLPSRIELVTLQQLNTETDAGVTLQAPPCISSAFTVNPDVSFAYWTSTIFGDTNAGKEWGVKFDQCATVQLTDRATSTAAVRCVAGAATEPAFEVSTRCGLVRDVKQKIEWQRASDAQPKGYDNTTPAKDADAHCRALDHGAPGLERGGWRAPTLQELHALIDSTKSAPVIDQVIFPGIPSSGGLVSVTPGEEVGRVAAVGLVSGEYTQTFSDQPNVIICMRLR